MGGALQPDLYNGVVDSVIQKLDMQLSNYVTRSDQFIKRVEYAESLGGKEYTSICLKKKESVGEFMWAGISQSTVVVGDKEKSVRP